MRLIGCEALLPVFHTLLVVFAADDVPKGGKIVCLLICYSSKINILKIGMYMMLMDIWTKKPRFLWFSQPKPLSHPMKLKNLPTFQGAELCPFLVSSQTAVLISRKPLTKSLLVAT